MADNEAMGTSFFMNLPLEVRHAIFEYAAARDVKPKKLLRYWFEKQEAKDMVAKLAAADPSGPAPNVLYHQDEYDSDVTVETSDEGDDDAEAEQDGEDNDEHDEEEDDDEEADQDEIDQDEDEDETEQEAETETETGNVDEDDAMDEGPDAQATALPQPSTSSQVQAHSSVQVDDEEGDLMEANTVNGDVQDPNEDEAAQAATEDSHDTANGDDEDMTEQDEHEDTTTTTSSLVAPPQPAPVFCPHHKWRHIPKFMRLTHRPPPIELLLTSKQLNAEAKNWYYNVAILRIEATGSFAHTSFYEEAFSQITDAAFSPMENIRKVEITFVWDTTWIRADTTGFVDAIFPAMLRQRSEFVFRILTQAPDLVEVVVHWHDSAQDTESVNFMLDILSPFQTLPANIRSSEHYIAADAKPHKKSIAGKRRVEFQNILDMGLDRLL